MARAIITEINPSERPGTTKVSGKAKLLGTGEIVDWISQEHRPAKARSKFGFRVGMEVRGTRRRGSKYSLYDVEVPRDTTAPGRYG